jgi:hypothetical protein
MSNTEKCFKGIGSIFGENGRHKAYFDAKKVGAGTELTWLAAMRRVM